MRYRWFADESKEKDEFGMPVSRAEYDEALQRKTVLYHRGELLAIAICAPLGAWLLGYSLAHIGLLTLMISLVAMTWNMIFNAIFDRAQRRFGFERTLVARALHAVLFEIGLLLAVVPLAAWWLKIGLWEAFVLDIGIALFFLPYTFLFNLAYDHLRARFVAKKIQTVPR